MTGDRPGLTIPSAPRRQWRDYAIGAGLFFLLAVNCYYIYAIGASEETNLKRGLAIAKDVKAEVRQNRLKGDAIGVDVKEILKILRAREAKEKR